MSPNPTLAFLESISLDRAELKFCERFDEQSRIWNFEKHSHPYFELILFLEGKATSTPATTRSTSRCSTSSSTRPAC